MGNVAEYITSLLGSARFARQVTHHRIELPREARYAEPLRPWSKAIADILTEQEIPALFTHQAAAANLIRAGRDVIIATPTASGKTLCYSLPILERFVQDRDCRTLMLFPLKALAQDQLAAFTRLTAHWPKEARPSVAIYDGDTSDYSRKKIRQNPPNVLITNPEMLHLGILPHHARWTTFLASLDTVVVDEAHTYRGVFGAHISQVFRRLQRICARYSVQPRFVLCTATVGNPEELAGNLLGRNTIQRENPVCGTAVQGEREKFCVSAVQGEKGEGLCGEVAQGGAFEQQRGVGIPVLRESGAPAGKRHFVFIDPENSPSSMAIDLLRAALSRKLRTIVYCRSRRMTELVALWAAQKAGAYAGRISAYRAGFLPEERREIEARMTSGDLLAVITTSALELGIDIGTLDLCILVGYPGTVMSTLQRGGRVGRAGQESAVLLVAGEDALDQYFIHSPEAFFARDAERAVLNPDNEIIVKRHLECAAAEMPLRVTEPLLSSPGAVVALAELSAEGLLLQSADGTEWLAARKRPQRNVDLRGCGATYTILDGEERPIGSVDGHQAFTETYPGAVYLHRGQTYLVKTLDPGARLVHCELPPQRVNWYTRARSRKDTEIIAIGERKTAFGSPVGFGRLRVTETVTGYEQRSSSDNRLLSVVPLDLPPQIFETEGLWFALPEGPRRAVEEALFHFMGSIHALEHACIGLLPLMVMADRNDFGGISTPIHPQIGGPVVFVYDSLHGGAGLCRAAFPQLEALFLAVRDLLRRCPCETGCPSCVHSPKCGSGNRPIDKAGALFLLEKVIAEPAPRLLPAISQPVTAAVPVAPPVAAPASRPLPAAGDAETEKHNTTLFSEVILSTFSTHESETHEGSTLVCAEMPSTRDTEPSAPPAAGPLVTNVLSVPYPERYMVFDVETRRSAAEVGGWNRADRMGVSVAVLYDSGEDRFYTYEQEALPALFARMQQASLVIGFNSIRFDYTVLQPFSPYALRDLPTLDLLDVVAKRLSYRVSLDNLGRATFNAPKSADGLQALRWWQEGNVQAIAAYCQQDVAITRDLYRFGHEQGYLLFTNKAGSLVRVPVNW